VTSWPAKAKAEGRIQNADHGLTHHGSRVVPPSPLPLVSQGRNLNALPAPDSLTNHASRITHPSPSGSATPRRPSAKLLRAHGRPARNALLDTAQPIACRFPIICVQGVILALMSSKLARLPDAAFRARLQAAGAAIVAYIPNQAYLVRASQAAAQRLGADSRTQAVVP